MQLTESHHGINLVIETASTTYIGRFDNSNGFQVFMHDCSIHPITDADENEEFVRNTAKYGVAVDQRDVVFDAVDIKQVRVLGEIDKG